jgi:hypothetical protein
MSKEAGTHVETSEQRKLLHMALQDTIIKVIRADVARVEGTSILKSVQGRENLNLKSSYTSLVAR